MLPWVHFVQFSCSWGFMRTQATPSPAQAPQVGRNCTICTMTIPDPLCHNDLHGYACPRYWDLLCHSSSVGTHSRFQRILAYPPLPPPPCLDRPAPIRPPTSAADHASATPYEPTPPSPNAIATCRESLPHGWAPWAGTRATRAGDWQLERESALRCPALGEIGPAGTPRPGREVSPVALGACSGAFRFVPVGGHTFCSFVTCCHYYPYKWLEER